MYSSEPQPACENQAFEWQPLTSAAIETESAAGDFVALDPALASTPQFVALAGGQSPDVDGSAPESGAAAAADVNRDTAPDALAAVEERTAVIEQEAYEKGFAQGEKDGFELGEKRAQQQVEKIARLLTAMDSARHTLLEVHEKEILAAVCAVAEKVVCQTVQADPAVIKKVVVQALELASEKSEVRLRIHPDDHAAVEKFRPEIFAGQPEMKSVLVTADPAVARGGCILETPRGTVDATLPTRLQRVRDAVWQLWAGEAHA